MKLFVSKKPESWLAFWKRVVIVLSIVGCAPGPPAMIPMQMAAETPSADVFSAGDIIETKFIYTPQFNEIQTVSPEGVHNSAFGRRSQSARQGAGPGPR